MNDGIKKITKYTVTGLLIVSIGMGGYFTYSKFSSSSKASAATSEGTTKVERGELKATITGTGTISAITEYDIVPLVKGTILAAPLNEGVVVKKGDLLYKIDDSDLSFSVEKSKISLNKLVVSNQSNVEDMNHLVVYAAFDGRITSLTLVAGDQVGANGIIATVVDDKSLQVLMPYDKLQAQKASVGQSIEIVFDSNTSPVTGVINYINSTPKASDNGVALSEVEVGFNTPVTVSNDTIVTANLTGSQGKVSMYGKVSYSKKQTVAAQTSGQVKQVLVKNNQYVTAGQKLLVLSNDNLATTNQQYLLNLKDTQLSLESQQKQLNDYTITSPIDGTIIKKSYKAGDTVNNSTSSNVLMTVADMSKMIFTINVDELDISKVSVGQKVSVTCDAVSGTKFEGEVTNIQVKGTTSNGVTTYPVKVTIASPGKLKPGMNVTAKIEVENKKDALYLPIAAVTKSDDKSMVLVKKSASSASNGNAKNAGAEQREVKTGINNDKYIEITEGLNEGDEVVYSAATGSSDKSSTKNNQNSGGMGGPMMGGPPPGG